NLLGVGAILGILLLVGTGCPGTAPTPGDACTNAACLDDGDLCTTDTCAVVGGAAECTHTAVACEDLEVCDDATGECVEVDCVDDADCLDLQICDANNECEDVECVDAADCADDGLYCTGDAACTANLCGFAGTPCAAGETCDEDADVCVAIPEDLSVTIAGCPDAPAQGDTVTLTATVINDEGALAYDWTVTGSTMASSDGLATLDVLVASGSTTVTIEVADTNGTATATCEFDAEFTSEIIVEAGALLADRSIPAGIYAGGVPPNGAGATNFINMLNGTASQQGADPAALVSTWSLTNQPAGSGVLTILQPNALLSGFQVGAPASAGTYSFLLEVTNNNTGESASDTIDLTLIDAPIVNLTGAVGDQTRWWVENDVTVDIPITYTASESTTIQLWAHAAGLPPALQQVLLGSGVVAAAAGGTATVSCDTSLLAEGAATLNLGVNSVDAVGATALAALTTVAATPGTIIVGNSLVNTPVNSAITGVAATTAPEPPFVDMLTEVGEPRAITVAQGPEAFTTDLVIHPGVGEAGGAADALGHPGVSSAQRRFIVGVDFNQDGLDDLGWMSANGVAGAASFAILFGANDIGTADGGAATANASNTGDWETAVAAYAVNVGTLVNATANAAGETVQAIASGDFNNDGNPDLATATNRAVATTASNARIILLGGSTDPANGAVTRTYTARATQTDATGVGVYGDCAAVFGGSDFTGDGVDDVAFSFPGTDVSGAGEEDGEVNVIYGDTSVLPTVSLPAAGTLLATAVAPNGVTFAGTTAANNFYGLSLAVGNYNGANADLVVGSGSVDGLRFYPGQSNALGAATVEWDFQAAVDMLSDDDGFPGHVAVAPISGHASGFDDIICGLPGEGAGGTIRIIPPGGSGNPSIAAVGILAIPNSRSAALDGEIGMAFAVGDVDQDLDNDLIVGNSTTGTLLGDVWVEYGPVSASMTFSDLVNDFDIAFLGTDCGSFVGFGDVNGDGLGDLLMADPVTDLTAVFGLQQ
ncbi:MAG: hypothetical protein GY842_00410, partial [bacterium]|nr:hypothetical protein [bacterium]